MEQGRRGLVQGRRRTIPTSRWCACSIEHADYWDVKENKLVQLYKMAEAAVTGKPPKMGEHGHIRPH